MLQMKACLSTSQILIEPWKMFIRKGQKLQKVRISVFTLLDSPLVSGTQEEENKQAAGDSSLDIEAELLKLDALNNE